MYTHGVYTVSLAGESPSIRLYTVCMYGSDQPCIRLYTVCMYGSDQSYMQTITPIHFYMCTCSILMPLLRRSTTFFRYVQAILHACALTAFLNCLALLALLAFPNCLAASHSAPPNCLAFLPLLLTVSQRLALSCSVS